MEIKNSLLKNIDPYRTALDNAQGAEGQKGRKTTGQAPVSKGDTVSVSPEALLRTEAYKTASSASDVRQEKVDAIKESIAAGTYTVDAKSIASTLLRDEGLLAQTLKE